jgi:hypothetical protein
MTQRSASQRLSRLRGGPVHALNGDIGTIVDFYFDEDTWTVRYIVVDTGRWLPGRQVLLPLGALLAPDFEQARIPVRLTREQVEHSPDIDTRRPVSRSAEARSLRYYGYPFYWGGSALWGMAPAPSLAADGPVPATPLPPSPDVQDTRETHLRSCCEVTGYHIRARDGEIGHIDDFIIDAHTWAIRDLLIDTSNWIGGRWVLIAPTSVTAVSWLERTVQVGMTRDAVARSAEAGRLV